MPDPTPVRLAVDHAAQELIITWSDGPEVGYAFEGLKRACPCVQCRGGHGRAAVPPEPEVWTLPSLQTYTLKEVRPVGGYAVQLVWEDGHDAGVWSWKYLRSLRPV